MYVRPGTYVGIEFMTIHFLLAHIEQLEIISDVDI